MKYDADVDSKVQRLAVAIYNGCNSRKYVIDLIVKDNRRLDNNNNVIKKDLRETSNLKWLRLNEVTAKNNNQLAISSIALAIPPVEHIDKHVVE